MKDGFRKLCLVFFFMDIFFNDFWVFSWKRDEILVSMIFLKGKFLYNWFVDKIG